MIFLLLTGCTLAPEVDVAPTTVSAPVNALTTPHTQLPTSEPTSVFTLEPTPEPAAIPVLREYTYEDQLVKDWMGNAADADVLRALMLAELSDDRFTDPEWAYIFLGAPKEAPGGYVLRAGKKHDGEWWPSVYHVVREGESFVISGSVSTSGYQKINRTRVGYGNEAVTVVYGMPAVVGGWPDDGMMRITITDGNGDRYDDVSINGNYLVVMGENAYLENVQLESLSGEPYSMELYSETSGFFEYADASNDFARILEAVVTVSFTQYVGLSEREDFPTWKIDGHPAFHPILYEARYDDGIHSIQLPYPMPFASLSGECHSSFSPFLYDENGDPIDHATLIYEQGDVLPMPESITAEYYPGETGEPQEAHEFPIRRPQNGEWEALFLRADYGDAGYLIWYILLWS